MAEVLNYANLIISLIQFIFHKAIIDTTLFRFPFIRRSPKAAVREGAEVISPRLLLSC